MDQILLLAQVLITCALAGVFRTVMGYAKNSGQEAFDWTKFGKTALFSVGAGIVFGLGSIGSLTTPPEINFFITMFLGIVSANYVGAEIFKNQTPVSKTPLTQ